MSFKDLWTLSQTEIHPIKLKQILGECMVSFIENSHSELFSNCWNEYAYINVYVLTQYNGVFHQNLCSWHLRYEIVNEKDREVLSSSTVVNFLIRRLYGSLLI